MRKYIDYGLVIIGGLMIIYFIVKFQSHYEYKSNQSQSKADSLEYELSKTKFEYFELKDSLVIERQEKKEEIQQLNNTIKFLNKKKNEKIQKLSTIELINYVDSVRKSSGFYKIQY